MKGSKTQLEFNSLKPMPLWESLIYFGGGCLLFILIERVIVPSLAELGVSNTIIFILLFTPMILFFFTALIAYRLEGNPWQWSAFTSRFRLHPIRGKFWLWVFLFVLVDIGLYLAVYQFGFPVVKWIHDLIPSPSVVNAAYGDSEHFAGFKLVGNWWLLLLWFVMFFFNIMGEELLWRGYIFPRQELKYGKSTWIVHGLLWTGFHLFWPYNALMVLPGALFMSYIVQRYKNTTIFILSHATLNALAAIRIVSGIIG